MDSDPEVPAHTSRYVALRRSSETSSASTVVNRRNAPTRVPLPLPYLPSDYEPSPTSPRHRFVLTLEEPIPLHMQSRDGLVRSTTARHRSLSTGTFDMLDADGIVQPASTTRAIEPSATPGTSAINHFELVPYREWTIISRNDTSGQMVLYNRETRMVTVRRHIPTERTGLPSATSPPMSPSQLGARGECPFCHRPFPRQDADDVGEPDFMDRNYFRLLETTPIQSPHGSPAAVTPAGSMPRHQTRTLTAEPHHYHPSPAAGGSSSSSPSSPSVRLNANAFNNGYYKRFFVEKKKLGRGFRGSVYLCEHELDGVKLGRYAVKKVAIGNNHPWLVKMLREVHLLERLRHPNIVNYKHAWLEYSQLTPFGPEIPCLFILMECANGGNLEEYMEPEVVSPMASAGAAETKDHEKSAKEKKRERIKRQLLQGHQESTTTQDASSHMFKTQKRLLTMPEIWSFFVDIVEGLAHLHRQSIVHRDLKPPNLLLKWDDRNTNHQGRLDGWKHRGIPRVLISDFGECEDLEGVPDKDRTGATGTLEFMAPEHVRIDQRGAHTKEYSPKADMWSLGMVLYYLCYTRLPYSNIDDVDQLREEILAMRDIEFPESRFDLYNDLDSSSNSSSSLDASLVEMLRHQPVPSDIPQELKLLIRMLLSIDPDKRPSCEEILSQLRKIQPPPPEQPQARFNDNLFKAMPSWSSSSTTGMNNNNNACFGTATYDGGDRSSGPSSRRRRRRPSWRSAPPERLLPPDIILQDKQATLDDDDMTSVHREAADAPILATAENMDMAESHHAAAAAGKRGHRVVEEESGGTKRRKKQNDLDRIYDNDFSSDDDEQDQQQQQRGLLLLGASSGPPPSSNYFLLLLQDVWKKEGAGYKTSIAMKTMTAVLKIATCTYTCYPYSPAPVVLYPVIALALLDFWSERVSHSLILAVIHIFWVLLMAFLCGGLCALNGPNS